MNLHERIASVRIQRELSQSQLALMIGVSRGACGQWEQGISAPNVNHLIRLAQALEVRFEWLATGRGDRELSHEVRENSPSYAEQVEPMSTDLRVLVAWIQRQPQSRQRSIIKLLKTVAELSEDIS